MLIPCHSIAAALTQQLQDQVARLLARGIKPKLVDFLVSDSQAQQSYIRIKSRKAQELGITFDAVTYPPNIDQAEFLDLIASKITSEVSGMIVQLPLPRQLDMRTVYKHIPSSLEIEGHRDDSEAYYPLSLAVLTGLKYIADPAAGPAQAIVDLNQDKNLLTNYLKNKEVVLLGHGVTAGQPIARDFARLGLSMTVIDSKIFPRSQDLIRQADIVITAVGKLILSQDMIKLGTALLNVGLHKGKAGLCGDYQEDDIADIASWHTSTPGGLGPIDVLYLYKNLLDAIQ